MRYRNTIKTHLHLYGARFVYPLREFELSEEELKEDQVKLLISKKIIVSLSEEKKNSDKNSKNMNNDISNLASHGNLEMSVNVGNSTKSDIKVEADVKGSIDENTIQKGSDSDKPVVSKSPSKPSSSKKSST